MLTREVDGDFQHLRIHFEDIDGILELAPETN
jgi:hypothetical protein